MRRTALILLALLLVFPALAQDTTPQDLADENGAFVTIDGAELYYIAQGSEDDPAVLLLHGFGGSTFTWRETVPALAEAGYYAVAFDRPPFGLSDKSADIDYGAEAQIDYTTGLMNHLGIDTAVMVGHSAGGASIAYFATVHPDRVAALVFVAAAIDGTGETSGASIDSALGLFYDLIGGINPDGPLARGILRRFVTPELFADMMYSAYGDDFEITPEIAAGYTRVLQVEGWEAGFLSYLVAASDDPTLDLDALAALDVPSLLMWGEADTWIPLSLGEELRALLPAPQWITYPDTGHLPMEESPAQFNADLIAFLDEVTMP